MLCVDVHGVSLSTFIKFFKCGTTGLSSICSIQNQNKQIWRCPNQSGTVYKGNPLVPECSGNGLKCRMPVALASMPMPSFEIIAELADEGHGGGTSSDGRKKHDLFYYSCSLIHTPDSCLQYSIVLYSTYSC